MAIEATTFTPVFTMFPWSDSSGHEDTLQPIGSLMANVRDGVIPVPGAGDSQEVRCDVTLPENFSYVLTDAYMSILGAGATSASNWEVLASLIFQDTTPGQPQTFELGLNWFTDGVSQATGLIWVNAYRVATPLPTFQQLAGGLWQTRAHNNTNDDIAAQFQLTMRFLVYTIGQQFDSKVNTPQLIR